MSAGFMGNVNDTNLRLVKLQGKEEDYTGKDGLLYCGKCHQPKEVYFSREKAVLFGHDRRPKECACQKKQRIEREIVEKEQRHLEIVEALKRRGFSDLAMRRWTFANDNGK